MIDRRFFSSRLGVATVLSVVAMVAFNVYAFSLQAGAPTHVLTAAGSMVVLS